MRSEGISHYLSAVLQRSSMLDSTAKCRKFGLRRTGAGADLFRRDSGAAAPGGSIQTALLH